MWPRTKWNLRGCVGWSREGNSDNCGPKSEDKNLTEPEMPFCRLVGMGAYCEIVGQYVDTTDNHDGIRIEHADGAWIHHNVIHDTVIDGGIALGYPTDGTDVHNNLVRGDVLAGHWAGELWNTRLWNNIVITRGASVTAYNESRNRFTNTGDKKHLA